MQKEVVIEKSKNNLKKFRKKEIKQLILDINNFAEPYRTILLKRLIKTN